MRPEAGCVGGMDVPGACRGMDGWHGCLQGQEEGFVNETFVHYLIDDFLGNPVHYSICTLPAPYAVADPIIL